MSRGLEPIFEMYIYETKQLLLELELILLEGNIYQEFTSENKNNLHRIIHTINGAAKMMLYTSISSIMNPMEDLFSYINSNDNIKYMFKEIAMLFIQVSDYIKTQLNEIEEENEPTGNPSELLIGIENIHAAIQQKNEKSILIHNDSRTINIKNTTTLEKKSYVKYGVTTNIEQTKREYIGYTAARSDKIEDNVKHVGRIHQIIADIRRTHHKKSEDKRNW